MARSIEDEREIGFSWFRNNTDFIHKQFLPIFSRKRRPESIFGYYDLRLRAYCEMPLCEAMLSLTLPNCFELKDEGKSFYTSVGKKYSANHFYGLSENNTVLCLAFGQFINPILAHARPFARIREVSELLPESVQTCPQLGLAILIENRDVISQKLQVDYV